jgi:hypothetical protein
VFVVYLRCNYQVSPWIIPGQSPTERRQIDVPQTPDDAEYLTVAEAQEWLGIGEKKMRTLLKLGAAGQAGGLTWSPDPLDARAKRIWRRDVEALLRQSPAKSAA